MFSDTNRIPDQFDMYNYKYTTHFDQFNDAKIS